MERLNRIVGHLGSAGVEAKECRSLRLPLALRDIKHKLHLPTYKMRMMQEELFKEMDKGLEGKEWTSVLMLPSFVMRREVRAKSGVYFALDLGGTNFRVLKLTLKDSKVIDAKQSKYKIPLEHVVGGTSDGLFGFIADSVAKFIDGSDVANPPLGFTFSFPMKKASLNSGILVRWTKSFNTKGVVGKDVCALLKEQFAKKGINMGVTAVLNDTVGTLVTDYFEDDRAMLGVIIGTGFNVAYWERVRNIPKYMRENPNADPNATMCINMEVGNFDSPHKKVLKYVSNEWDEMVDAASPNKGLGLVEKMVSGLYMGEIARYALLELKQKGLIAGLNGALENKNGFPAWHLSGCLEADDNVLSGVKNLLKNNYGVQTTLEERTHIRHVCDWVVIRSARLAATIIGSVVLKAGYEWDCTVAIDGSVFEKTPNYPLLLQEGFKDLFGSQPYNIRCVLTKDGSGIGAALSAALMSK
eukprot:CAMPEP_0197527314 /NCGR_PEP_ID=MMETSP1318-20131121/21053_1 /TAXON_ID=552666 /ORGANISM="Partenskyella glossopodia, Strain RCC365" /LENGTH=469 /DNA_ID=CAMNT_0043081883 /DNA_START=27 /DNA_END=1436 /DNA_ORIENTATION=-